MEGKVSTNVTVALFNAKTTGVNASKHNSNAIAGVMVAFSALISNMHHITHCVYILHTVFKISLFK